MTFGAELSDPTLHKGTIKSEGEHALALYDRLTDPQDAEFAADHAPDFTQILSLAQANRYGRQAGRADPNEDLDHDGIPDVQQPDGEDREQETSDILADLWESQNQAVAYAASRYDQSIEQARREQWRERQRHDDASQKLDSLDEEERSLYKNRNGGSRSGLKDDLDAAETAFAAGTENYNRKFREMNPNGPSFTGDGPTANEEAEEKLRVAGWQQQRDAIAADYKSKGLEAEFRVMEKSRTGESVPQKDISAAAEKIRAAGLSANLDVALVEKMKQTDPANPFLDTLDAKRIDTQQALEASTRTRTAYYGAQNDGVSGRLDSIDQRLAAIILERKTLKDQKDDSEKNITKLAQTETDLKQQKDAAVKYQEWLNRPEIKKGIASGDISLDSVQKQMKKDGYVDGTAKTDPSGAQALAMYSAAQKPGPAPAQPDAANPDTAAVKPVQKPVFAPGPM